MIGLIKIEFDCFFECVEFFLEIIIYLDCKDSENLLYFRKLDKKIEFMCFLIICRYVLYFGVMVWMIVISLLIMFRIFVGWCVFLSSIFEFIEMILFFGFVEKYMLKDFVEVGYSDIVVIGDVIEVWIF